MHRCMVTHRGNFQNKGNTLGFWQLCYGVGCILMAWFRFCQPLRGQGKWQLTAILCDHLQLLVNHLWSLKWSLNGLMSMKTM